MLIVVIIIAIRVTIINKLRPVIAMIAIIHITVIKTH